MKKLIVTSFLSLDGVMDSPEKWSIAYWNDAIENFKREELFSSDVQLLGRVTYEAFAQAWPSRTGSYADRLNSLPKLVVSTTSRQLPEWSNSRLLIGGKALADGVNELKRGAGARGDLLVHGSCTLVRSLMEDDLVDEYHLLVYPVVLGGGKRLFSDGQARKLHLVESRAFDSGAVLLIYRPKR